MKIDTFLLHKLLQICNIMHGQRSINAIYHILVGKQNHQTWSDVHFFHLSPYYRFLTIKDEKVFQTCIVYALQHGWIIERNNLVYVTEKGRQLLNSRNPLELETNRDGRIVKKMEQYWLFVHLLVQTLSHLLYHQNHFYPVVRDVVIQTEVKRWIRKFGVFKGAELLFYDLKRIFEQLPESHVNVMLQRLSGANRVGLTIEQLAQQRKVSKWQTKWEWEEGLTKLYEVIQQGNYPSLPYLPNKIEYLLSQTAKKTYQLLRKHRTIEEISQLRHLKVTTIMDHIVEISLLDPNFNIHPYISNEDVQAVQSMFQKLRSFKLKLYKTELPHLTYFQIRLALTRV